LNEQHLAKQGSGIRDHDVAQYMCAFGSAYDFLPGIAVATAIAPYLCRQITLWVGVCCAITHGKTIIKEKHIMKKEGFNSL
jgi:hypothetical protein